MLFKNKFHPRPLGVPLDELERMLSTTSLKISRDADSLTAKHETVITKLKVVPPERGVVGEDALQAVVQITTDLSGNLPKSLLAPEALILLNQMAVLGAITLENGRCFIGSRLSVFEQYPAWNLYIPFLLFTVISGSESQLGAIHRALGNREDELGGSAWTADDFGDVQSRLSESCACTVGDKGFTAEFGLRPDATSAAAGHRMTALWQLEADEPHPELGGGLRCTLHLPHRVSREQLPKILADLNRREMAPRDQPPHFGAWCQGNLENSLAYVSFLPNVMHHTDGVALNVSIWALHRAHWADAYLASIGVNENQPGCGIQPISISPPQTVNESKPGCEKPIPTAREDISNPSSPIEQTDERIPFYSLASLALQRAFTRSQQLAFQLRSLSKQRTGSGSRSLTSGLNVFFSTTRCQIPI
jgi:hypothetical protein